MNRGDRRQLIFMDDADRQSREGGIETLAEACAKTGWQVHAYVLMPNHFQLVVETPLPNLVAQMKWFLGNLHQPFQPAAQALRPLVLRSLQVADRGWLGRRLSQKRMRLRPPQSRAGQARGGGPGLEEFFMEQVTVHAQGREKQINLIRGAGQDEFCGTGIRDGMGWPLAQAVTASKR